MRSGWASSVVLAAGLLLAVGRDVRAQQRGAQATIGVRVYVVTPPRLDTLRVVESVLPALPAPPAADTVQARRSRLVLAYTGV